MAKPSKKYLRTFSRRILLLSGCMVLLFFMLHLLFPLPDPITYSTIITDDKGEVIHAFLSKDDKWRMRTYAEDISPLLKKTIIAKEDQYFYQHPGINPFAILRAMYHNIIQMKRTSGASTITMQVARALEPKKRTVWHKITEMFRALQLEISYSKEEILMMYLNTVPYGGNIEGVKAAALLYFNKSPDHLSLAEITALAIIPNRPSSLVIGKNNSLITKERNRWLQKFAAQKIFSAKEIADALTEPLTAVRGSVPRYIPHLAYRLKILYGGDLIKTNIHLNTQLAAEKQVSDYVNSLRSRQIRNAAVIIIDNKTNAVVSYIGSADFTDSTDGSQVNGAAAVRQPGSTLKPLLYGLCIDNGLMTPKTITTDVPVNYSGYAPENYNRLFNGYVTMEYALEHSLNIPAVKALHELGKDELVNSLVQCHFQQIRKDRSKLGLSMILGGCGTTLEEMTGLFAAFAHNGRYTAPAFIRATGQSPSTQILSPAAAYMINEILSKVNRPDFPLNWRATGHLPKIAWKTGTSYGRRDAWSIGYNKNYTVGVWVGNFSGQGIAELSGAEIATPLLFKIFNSLDYDNDGDWFSPPTGLDTRMVCSESGLPPGPLCTNIIMDAFIPLVSTTQTCNHLKEVKLSADGSISYCSNCLPDNGYIKKIYPVVDADMQRFYAVSNIRYLQLPPHNPACEKIFSENAPVIVAPANGNEYFISVQDREPLMLFCKTGNDVSRVYWYIDDQFYKSTQAGEKQFFTPREGSVKISCTDDKGRNSNIYIQVKLVNL